MKWQKTVDEQAALLSDKDAQMNEQAQEIIRLKKLLEEKYSLT